MVIAPTFSSLLVAVQDMLASWSQPFRDHFGVQHGAHYYELSFVESAVSYHNPPFMLIHTSVLVLFDRQDICAYRKHFHIYAGVYGTQKAAHNSQSRKQQPLGLLQPLVLGRPYIQSANFIQHVHKQCVCP